MSTWAWVCLGVYLGGVVAGAAYAEAILDNYIFSVRPRILLGIVLWPLLVAADIMIKLGAMLGNIIIPEDTRDE